MGDTEYCLSWIPLGGYVKMAGMIDESATGETTLTGAPWEFASKRTLQKLWVIGAGVLMNLLLGVVLYTGIAAVKGLPEASREPVVGEVNPPGWPAEKAGLRPGDRIVSIEGVAIGSWDDILAQIHPRAERATRIVYRRDGADQEAVLTPKGSAVEIDGQTRTVGKIGIGPDIVYRPAGAGRVLLAGFVGTGRVVALVASSLWKLATLQVSIKELGGPLMIAKLSGDSARQGVAELLGFIALISINIGFFNLLPIPALDGGHAFLVTAEGITRRQIPTRAKLMIQQVGMVLILGLIALVLVNDAQRIFDFAWLKRVF
jgi:regulator of sigma E protease